MSHDPSFSTQRWREYVSEVERAMYDAMLTEMQSLRRQAADLNTKRRAIVLRGLRAMRERGQ